MVFRGRAGFVTEDKRFRGDVGVYSRGDGSRVRRLQVADDEIVSWRERRAHADEFFRSARIFAGRGHRSSWLRTVHDLLLEIPIQPSIILARTVKS